LLFLWLKSKLPLDPRLKITKKTRWITPGCERNCYFWVPVGDTAQCWLMAS